MPALLNGTAPLIRQPLTLPRPNMVCRCGAHPRDAVRAGFPSGDSVSASGELTASNQSRYGECARPERLICQHLHIDFDEAVSFGVRILP